MSLPVYKTKLISPATCGRGSFTATSGRGPFTATCGRDSFLFSPRPVLGGCLPRTNSDCNLVRDPLAGGPNVTNAFYIAPTPRGGGFSFVLFYSPRAVGVCPVVTTQRGGDHLSRTNLGLIGAGSFRAQSRNLLKSHCEEAEGRRGNLHFEICHSFIDTSPEQGRRIRYSIPLIPHLMRNPHL